MAAKTKPKTKAQRAEELAQKKTQEFHDRLNQLTLKYSRPYDAPMVTALTKVTHLLMDRGEI